MIEVISESRCVACETCVKACPNEVFESSGTGVPRIARQEDCHTCFLCELYCPKDALYVSPLATPLPVRPSLEELEKSDKLGSYGRAIGWSRGRPAQEAA
jgi:NAD-dependent dihydropyrimidine dehydrogenase PreA subunit